MKVNGLRADDLAGTGLVTKQRWAMPLALGVALAVIAFCWRGLIRTVAVLVRCWRGTIPGILLAAGYLRHGKAGLAVVVGAFALVALVWWWRWWDSFSRCVLQRLYRAIRWHSVYRRRWPTALDACGLAWVSRDRVLFVPRVRAVHSTRVVDVLDLRLLNGQTPVFFTGDKGAAMRRSNFNRTARWPERVAAVGAPGLHFHDLRHSGNLLAAASGASLPDLMNRMGHDSMRAALIYQHATLKADRKIAQALERLLGEHAHGNGVTDQDDGEPRMPPLAAPG